MHFQIKVSLKFLVLGAQSEQLMKLIKGACQKQNDVVLDDINQQFQIDPPLPQMSSTKYPFCSF